MDPKTTDTVEDVTDSSYKSRKRYSCEFVRKGMKKAVEKLKHSVCIQYKL